MKKCNECGEMKPQDAFSLGSTYRGGRNPVCKICKQEYGRQWRKDNNEKSRGGAKKQREKHPHRAKEWKEKNPVYDREWKAKNQDKLMSNRLKNKYGITSEQYDQMVVDQGGRCAVCLEIPLGRKGHSKLNVDHDHLSGVVRGLLCGKCNMALGLLRENTDIMLNLVAYTQKHVKETATDA